MLLALLAAVGWTARAPPLVRRQRSRAVQLQVDPEEWRAFRAKLISGGLQVTGEGVESAEESSASMARNSVAPKNEELLKQQNEALWQEYFDGAWAHECPGAEAGGLMCRLPPAAQLVRLMRAPPGSSALGDRMRERLQADLPSSGDASESRRQEMVASWSQNAVYTFKLAEGLISETLEAVSSKASNGRVSWDAISEEQREMVSLYSSGMESWQEVCLVLETSSASVARECVVINRPIARAMSRELAELLLNGASENRRPGLPPLYDKPFLDRFLDAFGEQAAVYVGGPEKQEVPGLCVHGFDLPGAAELAPGTRIFLGGIEAVVDAVLDGSRSPLDFRWFVGRRADVGTEDAAWCPVACARPVALKQCLGLPKPLWHEVLELCGGEAAEISKIELLKRTDLQS